jgi:hypothetical protein
MAAAHFLLLLQYSGDEQLLTMGKPSSAVSCLAPDKCTHDREIYLLFTGILKIVGIWAASGAS